MGKIKPIKSKLKLAKTLLERYEKQTARGYLIKCSDGQFFVEEDCFKFSDSLYEQIQGWSLSIVIKRGSHRFLSVIFWTIFQK